MQKLFSFNADLVYYCNNTYFYYCSLYIFLNMLFIYFQEASSSTY